MSPRSPDVQSLLRRERVEALNAYKVSLGGCVDCGTTENLQLDHRDGTIKLFNPADVSNRPWPSLFTEWSKCDVRCASCHTRRHVLQRPPKNRLCSVADCPAPHLAKGYCRKHYWRNVEKATA